eukprot:gene27355-36119_t
MSTYSSSSSGTKKKKKTISHVKSGIQISELSKDGTTKSLIPKGFITSRTARVFLAGAGFLADAYDLFVINLVLRLLRDEYAEYASSGAIHMFEGSVASAALFGSILGQIVAGSLADVIGGEYPLAATVTSESSSAARRGSLMAAVFAMQGVGSLISVFVVIACLSLNLSAAFTWRFALAFGAVPPLLAFPWRLKMHETETFERVKKDRLSRTAYKQNPNLTLKYTGVPVTHAAEQPPQMMTYFAEKTSAKSSFSKPRSANSYGEDGVNDPAGLADPFPKDSIRVLHSLNSSFRGGSDGGRLSEILRAFTFYKWHMFGTALCWFLLDVDFYANGLFNHDVTSLILTAKGVKTTAKQDAYN